MTEPESRERRPLPLLLLLFLASGCAALVYEVVWFQMLQLVIGSSAVSLAVLLGTFMGGMFAGSLLHPLLVARSRHPLRVYAALEAGIAVCGVLLLFVIPWISSVYTDAVGYGLGSLLLRGLLAALLLLPPTVLMGATLPAVARWLETTPRGVSWIGLLYGANIAGAVAGCLLAAFVLLRLYDVAVATYAAAAINLAAAGGALLLARGSAAEPAAVSDVVTPVFPRGARSVHAAIALSGLAALGAQVVWTRLLSLLLGATVYTFANILAVFLVGLGLGSAAGARLARSTARARTALGVCQLLLVPAVAWAGWIISASLPYWPIDPSLATRPWHAMQLDLLRTAWAILPATLLWGASFPLAIAAAAAPRQDPARLVGGVYAANTAGAIVGSVIFGLIVIPWLGTIGAQRLLVVCAALAGLIVLVPGLARSDPPRRRAAAPAAVLAVTVMTAVVMLLLPRVPPLLVAYGRYAATWAEPHTLYVGEGMNATVAVTMNDAGARSFHVSGKVEASTIPEDMRLQRMLGHITALLHPAPRTVLIVGFGAGVTAGSFVLHPSVERIVICEIEPLIPRVIASMFRDENYDVFNDPRVEIIYDDARHYLLTTRETFDVITSDPIHPWVKGAAALYTADYFRHVRSRLNPGGIVTQWVPLYESSEDVVRSEVATFFSVFPDGAVWSNDVSGAGYDVVLAGANGQLRVELDALAARLARADHADVLQSLGDVGFGSGHELFGKYAGTAADLAPWLAGAHINRDRNLRLMYAAGLSPHVYRQAEILRQMLQHRRFPADLFTGNAAEMDALRAVVER